MSIKHVKKYYAQVEQQFYEMNQAAKELNEECKRGNVTQAQVDQAETMALPLRQNYERLSYLLYLLNLPNRECKIPKYERVNRELADGFARTHKAEEHENEDALKNFKKYIKALKEELNEASRSD